MVREKKMITNDHKNDGMHNSANNLSASDSSRPVDLAGDLSGVAHDITQLVELQGQLFVVDLKEAQQKLKLPIVLAIAGGLLSLCAMPLLLVAIAHALMLAGLSAWIAYGLVGVVGLAFGAVLLWLSWRTMKDSALVLDRSRTELTQNVLWLKQMLKRRSEATRVHAHCQN